MADDGAADGRFIGWRVESSSTAPPIQLEKSLKGNNDLLNLTMPELITDIHAEYLDAGSDMIETNTFNCTKPSMEDYDCTDIVYELNHTAAKLAKAACARVTKKDMTTPRFTCGAIGPTSRTLSVSPSVEDPSFRACSFDELVSAYKEQVSKEANEIIN